MIQLLIFAFTMGLLGSFHCVGMCGPIALSLPLNNDSFFAKFSGVLLYNIGRIFTYAVFGLIFGILGKSIALFGFQQGLSVLLGAVIIVLIILPKRLSHFKNKNIILRFFEGLRAAIGNLFLKKNYASLFSIGLLNGLLPCGMIYMAIAGAIATGDVLHSIFFMVMFGAGTLPMMWSIALFGNYISIGIRKKIRKAYPYMMMLMACLLILRGMGLGIPYISPKAAVEKTIIHCSVIKTIH